MKKYEYKVVGICGFAKKTLQKYGEEGWELVCVWGFWHYFKREKKN